MFNDLLQPWMLAALVAMAIPLIIEWLFRRRRQRIAFPAMRYLMNSKKRRKVQLQDMILLLVRTVVPAALVIAVARPLWRPAADQSAEQTPRHVVIVVDGSYSMGQSIGQTTAFAVAQSMAQDIVRGLPKNAEISLVYLGNVPRTLVERTGDHERVLDAIGRARVSDMAGRMADGLEAADRLLAATASTGEAYIISDLQRSTWSATTADPRDAQSLVAQLALRHPAFVLDTGGANPFNAYVTRFEPQAKALAVGMTNRFEVQIEAHNVPPNAKLLVTLYADEDKASLADAAGPKPGKLITRELAAEELRGGKASLVFQHAFVDPGEHLMRIELEGDGLTTDNQRHYLASVPSDVAVLVIDPRHDPALTAEPLATASGHLCNAVAPRTPPGFDRLSPFAVTTCRPEETLQLNLERYAVVALANVGSLNDGFVSRLEQYVSEGGNLLVFAGDAVAPYEYSVKLYKKGKGLLPCELGEATGLTPVEAIRMSKEMTDVSTMPLHGLVYTASEPHPAVAQVRQLTRQPAPPSVSRWMPMKPSQGAALPARPVVYLENRQTLVCEREFGAGKVMLVGTSPDASWNYLVYTGEYLVLMQELLRWLVGQPDRAVNLQIGDTFEQPVLLSSQYLLLRRPNFQKARLAPETLGEQWRVRYTDTDAQGVYEVDTTPEVLARRRFVVNLVATEGDLTRLDRDRVKDELRSTGVALWEPDRAVQRSVEERHSVREYAWLFLWCLLGLLAMETLLATRFGRRRI